jgi:hypothetical protein
MKPPQLDYKLVEKGHQSELRRFHYEGYRITNTGRTTCGTGSNYTYIDVDHLTPYN